MTEFDRHDPGTFCWVELSTTDAPAAKAFYASLFRWEALDNTLPEGLVYTMFRLEGRDVAAGSERGEQERSQGVPPHWNTYVCSDDVDQTAKAAEAAGGTVLAPAFDVLDSGRMTVISDPTGAVISAWQPNQHPGFGLAGVPGSFAWAELWTPDTGRAQAFYEEVFGWTAKASDMGGGPYTVFSAGDRQVAGLTSPPPGSQIPPNWLVYFEVADADAAVATAQEGGAQTMMAPMTMEGAGRFATLADPQGAAFAIIQSEPSA
jgi:predicted enzyme related to lactoylglutathione lyase